MHKIITVLVIYYPDIVVLTDNVKSLLNQTDSIIICNNSEQEVAPEVMNISERITKIEFGENIGIAAAQSIGMKKAFTEYNADFVLQMDQDSLPNPDMVKQLLDAYNYLTATGMRLGLVGALDFDRITLEKNEKRLKQGRLIGDTTYKEVTHTLSSGSLIPKNVYMAIGGMADDLFIDGIDSEYCWRLRKEGFVIVRNDAAMLGHRLGDGRIKIMGLLSVGVPTPIRHYYSVRNIFLLSRKGYVPFSWKCKCLAGIVFKLLFYPIFLPAGYKRLKFIALGIYDGVRGKVGKYFE